MFIFSGIRKLFGCALGPSRLEREQEYMRIEADMKKRREALIAKEAKTPAELEKLEANHLDLDEIELTMKGELKGTSDSKIVPTSHNKGQAPLAPINTDNNKGQDKSTQIPTSHNKRQAPLPPINTDVNVFAKAFKEATREPHLQDRPNPSTLLR